MAEIDSNF